jgi:hypothetical protein
MHASPTSSHHAHSQPAFSGLPITAAELIRRLFSVRLFPVRRACTHCVAPEILPALTSLLGRMACPNSLVIQPSFCRLYLRHTAIRVICGSDVQAKHPT